MFPHRKYDNKPPELFLEASPKKNLESTLPNPGTNPGSKEFKSDKVFKITKKHSQMNCGMVRFI